jgi:GH15 family glucan-1,4-alpha-glucosidase
MMVDAIREHLFSETDGRFLRSLESNDQGKLVPDNTLDASLFGLFYFGCFAADDERVLKTMCAVEEKLAAGGGIGRYEFDGYMRPADTEIGNAWFICTLWLAEFYIAKAKSITDLQPALHLIEWCADRALLSGVLSEQYDPAAAVQVSVSPLTWSHSTFVATVLSYQQKANALADKQDT